MKNSVATINSSFSEGGANSVLEAIQLGVPVLASDIAGNRGFLGDNYVGYFPSDDSEALASLMRQCLGDVEFLTHLNQHLVNRQNLFTSSREIESFVELLRA